MHVWKFLGGIIPTIMIISRFGSILVPTSKLIGNHKPIRTSEFETLKYNPSFTKLNNVFLAILVMSSHISQYK